MRYEAEIRGHRHNYVDAMLNSINGFPQFLLQMEFGVAGIAVQRGESQSAAAG